MFIREHIAEPVKIITESSQSKNCWIEGVFLQAEVKNKNGRFYPISAVKNAVDVYERDYINTGRALGQLSHPDGGGIDLHLVSHKIESLIQEGNNFIGKAKLLDTPMGNIAKALIKDGVSLGVSLRGYGSITKKSGMNYVGNDFTLATVDIVADPSAPDAFVTGIMENSAKFYQEGTLLQEHYDYIQTSVKNMTKVQLSEGELLSIFGKFLGSM